MKTIGDFLFVGMILVLCGLQGNNHPGRDRNNQSDRSDYHINYHDRSDHKQQTSFKLYPYYYHLNRRQVT